ncbi:hypothetical protein [Novosphingobium sp. Leaf2]|uniref:hypothetical protein n=1 Tax=Novosphingobium sp. Leaf2 TaxID=1735670 RepID=UPI000700BFEA|nr:hypothetical protein [Novosphingobium sp. Leaf2]KQM14767.1 hypothetical protein ASE49_11410 [Novosphingobium sp. Leaf2]
MNIRPAALLLTPLALAACTPDNPANTPPPAPAATQIGAAVDCLSVTRFNNTRIRDDRTIDFFGGAGNQIWRVTMPNGCPGLKSAGTFSYETSLTQLCKQDIIYPLQQLGGSYQRMGGCGMGAFVPVKLAK